MQQKLRWVAQLLFERNWLQVRLKWWYIIITDNGKKKCYHCSIVYSVTSSCDTWPRVLLAVRPPRRGQPRYKQQQRRRPRLAKRTQRALHRQKGLHLLFRREKSEEEEKSIHCEICRCECVHWRLWAAASLCPPSIQLPCLQRLRAEISNKEGELRTNKSACCHHGGRN